MATINITKALSPNLTGIYNPSYIQFTITAGTVPSVVVNSITFAPVKISTGGGLDTYVMDFQDIFKYVMPLPPYSVNEPALLSMPITVSVTAPASTTKTTSTVLCYAIDKIREFDHQLFEIALNGSRGTQYYVDKISFYFNGNDGIYDLMLNGSGLDSDVYLVRGFNRVSIPKNKRGWFSVLGQSTLFQIYGTEEVTPDFAGRLAWLDTDGKFVEVDTEILSTDEESKEEKEIPIYNYNYNSASSLSREMQRTSTKIVKLNVVAVNTDHFKELAKIKKSPVVHFAQKFWKVRTAPTKVAECRQNLSFTIELEMQEYAASY